MRRSPTAPAPHLRSTCGRPRPAPFVTAKCHPVQSRRMRAAPLVLVTLLLAGCFAGDDAQPEGRATPPGPPEPIGPPLRFAGVVLEAVTRAPLANATARLDLAQSLPCGRQGVGWTSWEMDVSDGRFGPLEVPRPRSDDVAFFLHVGAEGHSENATFIGPAQARGDIGNMTVLLHPDASVVGRAPPGTLVALDAPPFPRMEVADANGTFAFPHARAVDAALVAAVDVPVRTVVRAPAEVVVEASGMRGWVLEGSVKDEAGAPVAAELVAWNGSGMWSVARSSAAGAFSMPLAPEPVALRIEARTADGRLGGVLVLELAGPPALRETILVRPRC